MVGLLLAGMIGAASVGPGCQLFVDGELESVACSDEGFVGPPACPNDHGCVRGVCTPLATLEPVLGAPCAADDACAEGDFCGLPELVGEDAPPVCSRVCCTSADCGEAELGFLCVPSPSGLPHCRFAATVDREMPGEGRPGEFCTAGTECRSGLCDKGRCTGNCCDTAQCAEPYTCGLSLTPPQSFACRDAEGMAPYLALCDGDDDCQSGLCIELGSEKRCSRPCCGSEECGTLDENAELRPVGCGIVVRGNVRLQACRELLPPGATGAVGEVCSTHESCRSGVCDLDGGTPGVCSDACCSDDDCGDPSAFGCTVKGPDDAWVLRCGSK